MQNTGHPAGSYYAATANPFTPRPALSGDVSADVCIIGGGFTGLGAALRLAEAGRRVVLLEAAKIGSGASGRNGGQIHTGHRRGQDYLEALLGRDDAMALWRIAEDAKANLKRLVAEHAIACDLKHGLLVADHKPHFVAESATYAELLRSRYDYPHARAVTKAELDAMLGARGYHGGYFDADGGHLHPLNFALGIASAALARGAALFEESRALSYETKGGKAVVRTAKGCVTADWLILAGDGYLSGLDAHVEARVMPINNFILATEPLSQERARALIRDDVAVSDSRFVVNYYRLSADRRMLFGGGENYRSGFPPDLKGFVRRHMLKVFPQLSDARIDFAWGGALGITAKRLPFVRRIRPNVITAAGYSGVGVMLGPYFGKILGDAVIGTTDSFDILAKFPVPPFPGGRTFRWPVMAAAMSYYALRDRL
jgi:gamma-glutamylputrescine oxidase